MTASVPRRAALALAAESLAAPRVRLRFGWAFQSPNAFALVARERRSFREAGVDVVVERGTGSGRVPVQLASGAADIGCGDINPAIRFAVKNPDRGLLCVAVLLDRSPLCAILRADGPVRAPKDLEGRTLAAPEFDAGRQFFPAFALTVPSGLALGVAIGASPLLYRALYPLLIGFNSVLKVAVVPVLVIWFGSGIVPAVITAFLISFFPIVVNVATGIATVEPELRDVLRALGAGRLDIVRKVGLPRAMPYFFVSLKVAITVAFVGSVIAETVAGNQGVGHLMLVASSRFDVPLVFAGLVVTGAMGVAMYALAAALGARTTGWATRGQRDGPAFGA